MDAYSPVVVDRIVHGYWRGPTTHYTAEVQEVIRRLAPAGYSDGQIAYLCNRHCRAILRLRMALGVRGCATVHYRAPRIPSVKRGWLPAYQERSKVAA
jgi:hypothetical protein